jgi:hypothetical protein
MKWFNSNNVLLLIAISSLWIASNIHWGKDHWKGILESDAKGYYAYLPATFIYFDPNFGFFEEIETKYPQPLLYYDYRQEVEGSVINKYYLGSALCQSPFFLMAHGFTLFNDPHNADGYSKLYQIAVSLSSLFYLWIGLFFIRRSLQLIELQDAWISMLLLSTLFASNLFVYAITDPGYSHIYSFGILSFFLWKCLQFKKEAGLNHIYWLAFAMGLMVLIRPINIMVVFALPFIFGSKEKLVELFQQVLKPKVFLISLFLCLSLMSFQLIFYKLAGGHWWIYSYKEEGFNFLEPHFFDILFSYRKGLFLYTPLYLLSFIGLIKLWSSERFRFWAWLIFFSLLTYILSSWWMWFYGASFSSRVYIEYLPLFILLFAFYLKGIKRSIIKWTMISILILLTAVCQIQIYQYRHYIIHYSEMTKEKYWEVFLQL